MHYNPSVAEAFNSVEHIMRDVNNGWLIRYLHGNTASAFFFLVYLHIGKGLYYGSYKSPRTLVWTIGTIIFLIMMATAFLGYVLPYGQMSLWGATVITNLMSAIPWVGQDIVEFIWGGFSVNNATLNRFFSLHFILPFVLAALVLMHLIALHDSAGSGNPLGISGNYDRLPFAPYFIFKDLVTIFIFFILLSMLVFFMPNLLGDSENYVMANPMQTPPAIVPEWYLLPFYAILRSIPNKLLGVIAMFSAILILLVMPFVDLGRNRGIQFRPLSKIAFYVFVGNFFILLELGAKHVESPFIEFGQISTVLYFSHFLIIIPLLSVLENSLIELIGEESLNEDTSYNNLVLYRSSGPIGIAALGSVAVNGITGENTGEENASGNDSENATNLSDTGSGDLEKERRIYKILNDCHSEVQDEDGDPTGTIQTLMEIILEKQHNIVEALVNITSSGSGT
jgi:ubiquinol-cytochrome c reductase cytochrome b subunit